MVMEDMMVFSFGSRIERACVWVYMYKVSLTLFLPPSIRSFHAVLQPFPISPCTPLDVSKVLPSFFSTLTLKFDVRRPTICISSSLVYQSSPRLNGLQLPRRSFFPLTGEFFFSLFLAKRRGRERGYEVILSSRNDLVSCSHLCHETYLPFTSG